MRNKDLFTPSELLTFHRLVIDDVLLKYSDLKSFHVVLLCGSQVVIDDNGGYFTHSDISRYTGYTVGSSLVYVNELVHLGYVVPINKRSSKHSRKFDLTIKGKNLIAYYNRLSYSLLRSRTHYVSRSGRSSSVLYSGAQDEGYYQDWRQRRINQAIELNEKFGPVKD